MQRHDDALVVVALITTLDMFVLLRLRLRLLSQKEVLSLLTLNCMTCFCLKIVA